MVESIVLAKLDFSERSTLSTQMFMVDLDVAWGIVLIVNG